MYVAMPYFDLMGAMVSCCMYGENTSHVWNPCFLFHFAVFWAKVRMGRFGSHLAALYPTIQRFQQFWV